MVVARNWNEYRKLQQTRIKNLRKVEKKSPVLAAQFMAAQLRATAPRWSGNMIKSIRRDKNTVQIGGSNKVSGFPYVHWVCATPGMGLERIQLGGKKMLYSETNYSATHPHFYWISMDKTRLFFRDNTILFTRATLRSSF